MILEPTIYDCQTLRTIGVVDMKVVLRLGQLKSRSRTTALRWIREGWIRTSEKSGLGRLLALLMGNNRVWHLRGARKHRWVSWIHNMGVDIPRELDEIRELCQADWVAAELRRADAGNRFPTPNFTFTCGHRFRVIDPEDHIPQILKPYVETAAYQLAIRPVLEVIERGDDMEVRVQPPRWNGRERI